MRPDLVGIRRAGGHVEILLVLALGVARPAGFLEARREGEVERGLARRERDGLFEFRDRRDFVAFAVQRLPQVVLRRVIGGKDVAGGAILGDRAIPFLTSGQCVGQVEVIRPAFRIEPRGLREPIDGRVNLPRGC